MTTLKDVGEEGILAHVYEVFGNKLSSPSLVGVGDDAAVIHREHDKSLLVTIDSLVEGTHFLFDKISPFELGQKSLSVNLSDIAAMGGTPKFAFLSLGARKNIPLDWVREFFSGIKACASRFGVVVLGGDTVRSDKGEVISIALLGECKRENLKLRSGAKPGDVIAVTGTLGDSAAGLKLLLKGIGEEEGLIKKHLSPRPHVEEGTWLGEISEVTAMMDISDGISLDLERMAKASNVSIELRSDLIPISEELRSVASKYDLDTLKLAFSGGEDYVLAAAIKESYFKEIENHFQKKFNSSLYKIGEVKEGKPYLTIMDPVGKLIGGIEKGFDNFS